MSSSVSKPHDLARIVAGKLSRRTNGVPPQDVLTTLFEQVYFATLRTEESKQITLSIVYIDPMCSDPQPPRRIVQDRWTCVRLTESIPITGSSLAKLAVASDPRSSSFAVYHDDSGDLFVWGIIDQQNRYHQYLNYDTDSGPERPGLFQATTLGLGHIRVTIQYETIAELKVDSLTLGTADVFRSGPVMHGLRPGFQAHAEAVLKSLDQGSVTSSIPWTSGLVETWISTLCRLLIRMQNYRHGGAVLITSEATLAGLNIKYMLPYSRLRTALQALGKFTIQHAEASRTISDQYMETGSDELPMMLYLDEAVSRNEEEDASSELDGTLWFVSLLSRVDGLVLVRPNLDVVGFGVEITISDEPKSIFLSQQANPSITSLPELPYSKFGTRHRSMMRYCASFPGSIGFVVSQDGDVRVMTSVGKNLIVFENIGLQFATKDRRRNRRSAKPTL